MAEAIARVDAGDVIEPASAGLYPLGQIPLHTQDALQRNGYSTDGLSSKPIAPEAWSRADLVINISGRLRELEFEEFEKVEDWSVPDPYGEDAAIYQRILEDIQRRVKELANRLRQERPAAV